MGVRVIIGMNERANGDITPQWITEQINRLRHDGASVCAKVILNDHNGVNLSFATSGCSGLGGGGGRLNDAQQRIVDLWRKLHLNNEDFAPGNLVAFLKQLGC